MVSAEQFWQFSLAAYAQNKQAYLLCQRQYGLNVNLLLWCKYLDAQGIVLKNSHFTKIKSSIAKSDKQLQSLRSVRQAVKGEVPEAYSKILEAELLLEQQQQQLIVQRFAQCIGYQPGEGNLDIYLDEQKTVLDTELYTLLAKPIKS